MLSFVACGVSVCLFAWQVVWTGLTRKSPENAWVAKVPTWPLTFVFLGQVAAVAGGVYWVVEKGESWLGWSLLWAFVLGVGGGVVTSVFLVPLLRKRDCGAR